MRQADLIPERKESRSTTAEEATTAEESWPKTIRRVTKPQLTAAAQKGQSARRSAPRSQLRSTQDRTTDMRKIHHHGASRPSNSATMTCREGRSEPWGGVCLFSLKCRRMLQHVAGCCNLLQTVAWMLRIATSSQHLSIPSHTKQTLKYILAVWPRDNSRPPSLTHSLARTSERHSRILYPSCTLVACKHARRLSSHPLCPTLWAHQNNTHRPPPPRDKQPRQEALCTE